MHKRHLNIWVINRHRDILNIDILKGRIQKTVLTFLKSWPEVLLIVLDMKCCMKHGALKVMKGTKPSRRSKLKHAVESSYFENNGCVHHTHIPTHIHQTLSNVCLFTKPAALRSSLHSQKLFRQWRFAFLVILAPHMALVWQILQALLPHFMSKTFPLPS